MNTQFISWHIHPAPQYVDPLKEGPRLLACQPVEKLLHASLRALIEDSAPQFCSVLAVFTRVWMLFGLSASRRATFATGCLAFSIRPPLPAPALLDLLVRVAPAPGLHKFRGAGLPLGARECH